MFTQVDVRRPRVVELSELTLQVGDLTVGGTSGTHLPLGVCHESRDSCGVGPSRSPLVSQVVSSPVLVAVEIVPILNLALPCSS